MSLLVKNSDKAVAVGLAILKIANLGGPGIQGRIEF
jgi:hypothetical protein